MAKLSEEEIEEIRREVVEEFPDDPALQQVYQALTRMRYGRAALDSLYDDLIEGKAVALQVWLAILVVWNSDLAELLGYIGFTLGLSAAATFSDCASPAAAWSPAGALTLSTGAAPFLSDCSWYFFMWCFQRRRAAVHAIMLAWDDEHEWSETLGRAAVEEPRLPK